MVLQSFSGLPAFWAYFCVSVAVGELTAAIWADASLSAGRLSAAAIMS